MDTPENWIANAVEKIKKTSIKHPKFLAAHDELYEVLNAAEAGEVVVLVGPSRVGKSRLQGLMKSRMAKEATDADAEIPLRPWVGLTATNDAVHAKFKTKPFICDALIVIQHPIYGAPLKEGDLGIERAARFEKTSEPTLRQAFERGLQVNRTRFLSVDEAHHVGHAEGGAATASQILDSWKCLAFKNQLVLVLVGAYPILNVMQLSTHMIGRELMVHFPRYRIDDKADRASFAAILKTYDEVIKLAPEIGSLTTQLDFLMRVTLGCVGHLSNLLRRALATCKAQKAEALTLKHLESAAHKVDQLHELLKEIQDGEHFMQRDAAADCNSHDVDDPEAAPLASPATTQKKIRASKRPFQAKQRNRPSVPRL